MKRKDRLLLAMLGALAVAGVVTLVLKALDGLALITWSAQRWKPLVAVYSAALAGGGALAYALGPRLCAAMRRVIGRLVGLAGDRPLPELLLGLGGSLIGLTMAFFVSTLIAGLNLGVTGTIISACIYALMGTAGYALIGRRWNELPLSSSLRRAHASATAQPQAIPPKVLDTSVLVDGRIFDICRAGFIEGVLVLPQFVLEELQHIADSSDALKRNRGRRGLDIVTRIQKETDVPITLDDSDFDDTADVDIKLLKLAKSLGGSVMTNDFNLSKVAGVAGVKVLSINELAAALKPALLPGEELTVQIVREGKELGQGVAFMDDGTMIVVENGRRHIGQTVPICVNTVLQTAAGRMIFARLRERVAG